MSESPITPSKGMMPLLAFLAGTNAALEARSRRERPLPSNYCPKCRIRMNQASKHKLVCPSCKQVIKF